MGPTTEAVAQLAGHPCQRRDILRSEPFRDQGVDDAPGGTSVRLEPAPALGEAQDNGARLVRMRFARDDARFDQSDGHRAHAGWGDSEFAREANLGSGFHAGQRLNDAGLPGPDADLGKAVAQLLIHKGGCMQKEMQAERLGCHARS